MRAGEREPVLDLLERAFSERALFARYMDEDPAYDPSDILLALDGARPVSCVQVFAKRIRLRGSAVPLGGIGSVATHPDYRKRGLALELLRGSEARMRERGMQIGLLFSTLWDFYGRLGWLKVPARQLAVHCSAPPELPQGLGLRRFDEARDLAAVRALYEAYSAGIDGTTLRDDAYWRGQLRYAGNPDEDFRVAERAGRIVAYARAATVEVPMALEFACAPDAGDALVALLLALAPRRGALLVRLPPGEALEQGLRARAARVDRVDYPALMWRVLDAAPLGRLAGQPGADDATLLDSLIRRPGAHYWHGDRF